MKVNLFLTAVLVALIAANLGINDNPVRRNFEAMPEMVRSSAYKSYSANPISPTVKLCNRRRRGRSRVMPPSRQRAPARSFIRLIAFPAMVLQATGMVR